MDVGAISLSGLAANEKRLQVAANNIANANTDGFKAQAVEQSSLASGGVRTKVVTPTPAVNPTVAKADNDGDAPEPSNVSLEENLVQANFATYGAQANLKVLQTQSKVNKYLLDIQA